MEKITKKPATIEDVAKIAGVSIATVSRALHFPEKVSESTRKKITSAIARTGYRANPMAQNLRMQRSKMVMVLTNSISDPNFPGILTGLEKVANQRGYGLLIGSTDGEVKSEENYMRFLASGMTDGLITLTGSLPNYDGEEHKRNRLPPLVAVAEPIEHTDVSYVGTDNFNASKLAVEYLISLGHKKIVYISGPQGGAVSELRHQGYCAALGNAFNESYIWKVSGNGTSEGGRAAIEQLFIKDKLPTAFFCYNDDTAIGAIHALQSRGFNVPRDFSVIGFDDIPFSNNVTPSLTTIRQPRSQIGEIAMDHLLDNLPDRTIPIENALLRGELIIRNSCSTPEHSKLL